MIHPFIRFGFGFFLAYVAVLPIALAQGYPSRPVKIVVASAPGSTPDIVARLIGQELAKEWGQGVVIENKASAGGAVAIQQILQSPADGYTLLLSPSSATCSRTRAGTPPTRLTRQRSPKAGSRPS